MWRITVNPEMFERLEYHEMSMTVRPVVPDVEAPFDARVIEQTYLRSRRDTGRNIQITGMQERPLWSVDEADLEAMGFDNIDQFVDWWEDQWGNSNISWFSPVSPMVWFLTFVLLPSMTPSIPRQPAQEELPIVDAGGVGSPYYIYMLPSMVRRVIAGTAVMIALPHFPDVLPPYTFRLFSRPIYGTTADTGYIIELGHMTLLPIRKVTVQQAKMLGFQTITAFGNWWNNYWCGTVLDWYQNPGITLVTIKIISRPDAPNE